jgi:hypothetical protein
MSTSYLTVFSDFSNLKDFPQVQRFLSSFCVDVRDRVNRLIAIKDTYGAIGGTALIGVTGSGNYGASFISTGTYWIGFREPYVSPPSVVATAEIGNVIASVGGVTTTGFGVLCYSSGALYNSGFNFHAKGSK